MASQEALSTSTAIHDIALGNADFARLSAFIESETGIQVPPTKRVMLESRLRKRLRALGLHSFSDYADLVLGPHADQGEIVHLIDVVTTNKTDFFREPAHFDYLVREALPELLGHRSQLGQPITVWSAASSTGEEPYTLAMVLSELAEKHPMNWQIIATDISTRVLESATRAIYSGNVAAPIPLGLKTKYLLRSRDREKNLVRIVPSLRRRVTFRRLNLLSREYDVPRPVDVIFCRNVFIYFNRQVQRQILSRFVDCLRPGGYVFLGHSETTNGFAIPLVQVAPTIYRKEP